MRSPSFSRLLTAACLATALAACSDSNAPAPAVSDKEATADLAISAGDAIATDVSLMIGGAFVGMSLGRTAGTAGATLAATNGCALGADGRHTCTATTENGLTHTHSFAFYDAANAIQPRFDETTTASINFQMTLSGTVTREHVTATISRERNITLSGLAGAETQRTWNGTGSSSHNSTATGERGTRTYVTTSKDTTTNVVFALPRAENPWPTSGTIVHNMSSTATFDGARSGTRTVTRRALVTFNGTSSVPLQVGDRSCTLNLETKSVSCPSGR